MTRVDYKLRSFALCAAIAAAFLMPLAWSGATSINTTDVVTIILFYALGWRHRSQEGGER